MGKDKYVLRYLSLFETDLNGILDYIALNLRNPESANRLADKIEKAILKRLEYPLSFERYQSNRKRKHPYYRIYVDNFVVYYVVIENIMEVRRVLFKGRDAQKIIK